MVFVWPGLVVNLKQHLVGRQAAEYALEAGKIAFELKKPLVVCPAIADLDKALNAVWQYSEANNTDLFEYLKIFSQKVDAVSLGDSATGAVCLESLENIHGSLLNHFEARIYGSGKNFPEKDFERLMKIIGLAAAKDFPLIACADSAQTAVKIAKDATEQGVDKALALAVEWDAFIGKRISMVKEKPEEISQAVEAVRKVNEKIPVYCGAGVETKEDIKKAVEELGAQGVLAATGFTKAPGFGGDFKKALKETLAFI